MRPTQVSEREYSQLLRIVRGAEFDLDTPDNRARQMEEAERDTDGVIDQYGLGDEDIWKHAKTEMNDLRKNTKVGISHPLIQSTSVIDNMALGLAVRAAPHYGKGAKGFVRESAKYGPIILSV